MQYLKSVHNASTGETAQVAVELIAGAAINKSIGLVIRKAARIADEIHGIAMQAFMHTAEHGDPVHLDRLFKGLHDSQRPLSIKRWAMKYGPLGLTTDKAGNEVLRVLPKTKKDGTPNPAFKPFDVQGAAENPYWTFKGDKVVENFTLAQLLEFVAKKVKAGEKAIDEDQFEGNVASFMAAKADLEGVIQKYVGGKEPSKALGNASAISAPEPIETAPEDQVEAA